MKNTAIYFLYLLVVWGVYRLLFRDFSLGVQGFEELLIKPIIWLVPIFYLAFKKERKGFESIGVTKKNLFPSIYFSFALGAIFAMEGLVINFLKYGSLNFSINLGEKTLFAAFGLSLATAISEEIAFRGYIFGRLFSQLKNEISANIISTCGWVLIHMPITLFVSRLSLVEASTYLVLTGIFGIGANFVFARTKNIFSSILLHVLWQWPIILFR